MPIVAALLSSVFGSVATYLAARMSIGLAAAAAFLVTSAAAYVAVKAAILGLQTGLTVALGSTTYTLIGNAMPGNIPSVLTAILIADAIISAWDYWRQTLGVAMHLAKA